MNSMKQKISVTFEVKTEVEVDVPNSYDRLDQFVLEHKNDITQQAKQNVMGDVEKQLTWDNLLWSEKDEGVVLDFSNFKL